MTGTNAQKMFLLGCWGSCTRLSDEHLHKEDSVWRVVAYTVPVSLRRLLMVRPTIAAWMHSPLKQQHLCLLPRLLACTLLPQDGIDHVLICLQSCRNSSPIGVALLLLMTA